MTTPKEMHNLARSLRAEAKTTVSPLHQAKLKSLADQLDEMAELCRLEKVLGNHPAVEANALR